MVASPFARFQRDVADKPSHTTISALPAKRYRCLHVANKVQIAAVSGNSAIHRLFDGFVAFNDFFTNIEQANGGCVFGLEYRNQSGTHHSELQQMFRRAIHVRPKSSTVVAPPLALGSSPQWQGAQCRRWFSEDSAKSPSKHLYCQPIQPLRLAVLDLLNGRAWMSPSSCAGRLQGSSMVTTSVQVTTSGRAWGKKPRRQADQPATGQHPVRSKTGCRRAT